MLLNATHFSTILLELLLISIKISPFRVGLKKTPIVKEFNDACFLRVFMFFEFS